MTTMTQSFNYFHDIDLVRCARHLPPAFLSAASGPNTKELP